MTATGEIIENLLELRAFGPIADLDAAATVLTRKSGKGFRDERRRARLY